MAISFQEFQSLAKQGNCISLFEKVPADLTTPVATLLRFPKEPYLFLFESVEGGERWGRYSFLGISPRLVIRSSQKKWDLFERSTKGLKKIRSGEGEAFPVLEQELKSIRLVADPELPKLCGGAVGYLAYDMVRDFERLPNPQKPSLDFPDFCFGIYDRLIIFDNLKHCYYVVVNVSAGPKVALKKAYAAALNDLNKLLKQVQAPLKTPNKKKKRTPLKWKSSMSSTEYQSAVLRAQEYIRAGDIFQVVLSTRWEALGKLDPFELYRKLRLLNPSPYLFCLKMGEEALVGSSPEVLVRLEGAKATVRPIAGTRKRGENVQKDEALALEMLADPKERAEHIMLVDLGRNDLGRVCDAGSVEVNELMAVERYSHVMHLVSNVEGQLQKKYNAFDLLKAAFPAGTLSGAPKIRAMEIIDELETVKRGPYGGCVGYIDFTGNMDMAITIRSVALGKKGFAVQAGAGIVQDSIPEREYQECQNKAKAVMEAIKQV